MSFPTFTISDVATATGRDVTSYPQWTNQALAQAMLMFRLGTCLTTWPTDQLEADTAKNAILFMADQLVILQPYQELLGGPFQSETIASYTYSLKVANILLGRIQAGSPTGNFWFDSAVALLGVCDSANSLVGGVAGGSINVFEDDGCFFVDSTGQKFLLGPKDFNLWPNNSGAGDPGDAFNSPLWGSN